ncbi:MAG TPA: response regulator [Acidobacteriaceae bacterium]
MDTTVKPADQIGDQILVIDDDAIMRELLLLLLGTEGHSVSTAESGDDALAALAGLEDMQMPSVVLTDLKMPGLSHSELAARLRSVCPSTTVLLAMSASEPAADETNGFDAFLRKPFSVAGYNAAVERARSEHPAETVVESPTSGELDSSSVPAVDEAIFAKLSSLMSGAQVLEIYTMCLGDAAARADRMSSAVAVNDAVTFVRAAHVVKGGCGMLGATELYALAGRMETGGLECSSLLHDFRSAIERLRRILVERIDRDIDERTESQN